MDELIAWGALIAVVGAPFALMLVGRRRREPLASGPECGSGDGGYAAFGDDRGHLPTGSHYTPTDPGGFDDAPASFDPTPGGDGD
jgi:hypothetical protein